jgi:hypothetical protein
MSEKNKSIAKVLTKFLEKKSFPGVCGFWIDEESIAEDEKIFIYLILDESFIRYSSIKPDILATSMKNSVKRIIDQILGEDLVRMGSIVRDCENL